MGTGAIAPVPGSSPLTRGKPSQTIHIVRCLGLIPAHAGKTSPSGPKTPNKTAHPRSRGENTGARQAQATRRGSSPLTRGKPRNETMPPNTAGLIPAHAGKTLAKPQLTDFMRAHPRSRGENSVGRGGNEGGTGSSPLTRGKRDLRRIQRVTVGLIPAHAGKTSFSRGSAAPSAAHPRSRGENRYASASARSPLGSSPLTRGKHHEADLECLGVGLIPAHAGKTLADGEPRRGPGAHPRSRGENASVFLGIAWSVGSSPLTRGKPRSGGRRGSASWAHPRSRGENRVTSSSNRHPPGSSPLTRGKLPHG